MAKNNPHVYTLDGWIEDLRICVKTRGQSVTEAAASCGLSRATAYRLISQAKTEGAW